MRRDYLKKLEVKLAEQGLDAAFIAPSVEMKFFLGVSPMLCERFQGFFVTKEGEYFYIVNLMSEEEIKEMLGSEVEVFSWFDGEIFTDIVRDVFDKKGMTGKKIAVNSTARAENILEIMDKVDVNFVNGRELFNEVRIIKSKEEVENLKEASKIADEVFEELLDFIKPGMKEKDIQDKIASEFRARNAEFAFAIVASGPNSAHTHYNRNDRVIQEKDILLLDYGCIYKDMLSDITRTIFIGGITEKEREIYNIVLEANLAGEAEAKEGAIAADVDKAARDIISKAGYGEFFTTRVGNGIGYYIHEAPDIKGSNKRVLENGMAFSIEPGIYLPNQFGVRIEDQVVLTDKGTYIMNKVSKDIIII